jgi:PadR family transcriptional regulator PadR
MEDLTAFQRDILYVAAGMDEPHGLGIKAELEDYYEGDVNHGRLYPNLDDLVEKGLLGKGTHDQRTNSYTLTDDGRHALQRRREWELRYVRDTERVDSSRA